MLSVQLDCLSINSMDKKRSLSVISESPGGILPNKMKQEQDLQIRSTLLIQTLEQPHALSYWADNKLMVRIE